MKVNFRKLSAHIGAEVLDLDLNIEHSPETIEIVKQAWLDNLILLFRGQSLDAERQLAITKWFGEPGKISRPKEFHPKGYSALPDGVMLISNVRENGEPIGALPDGEMMFHHDMMHAEIPHKATILNAKEIPSEGGNTLFASGYAAYQSLPSALRDPLEGKRAFHHYNYGSVQKGDGKGTPAFAESNHPVFRTHSDTGRKAIYVNRLMTEGIVGMEEHESKHLLSQIFDHSERKEFIYEHVWNVGDVILWDNRCSMHARKDFPDSERRLLLRTTVKDDRRPF